MKVLFIDDENMRHQMALSLAKDEGIDLTQAFTIDEAIEFLESDNYDLVCIDHDMRENKRNGTDIAKKIHNDGISIPFVWIHSANPVGAMNIKSIITKINGVGALVKEPFNFITLTKVFSIVKDAVDEE